MPDAFFEPDGERFAATALTRGPWDRDHQHAGPPAALLARTLERMPAERPMQVARVTFEIIRPIPIAPLSVAVEWVRAGRSVELLEGSLSGPEGELVRARAWRIRTGEVDVPAEATSEGLFDRPPPGPDRSEDARPFFDFGWDEGYHTAMDARVASGHLRAPGPAAVWMRMRVPLVAGEETSPLTRVLAAADSGNGVSWALDLREHLFVNSDLSVHLHRLPEGEWVCIDARTAVEPNGIGLADTRLWDQRGRIGRGLQTLLVDRRS